VVAHRAPTARRQGRQLWRAAVQRQLGVERCHGEVGEAEAFDGHGMHVVTL
jgi:hypothetical protein